MASLVRLGCSSEDVWPSPSRVMSTAPGIWWRKLCAHRYGVDGSCVELASRIGGAPWIRARCGGVGRGTGPWVEPLRPGPAPAGGVRGERAGEQRCGYEVVEAADEPRVVDAIHGESRERPVPRAAHE